MEGLIFGFKKTSVKFTKFWSSNTNGWNAMLSSITDSLVLGKAIHGSKQVPKTFPVDKFRAETMKDIATNSLLLHLRGKFSVLKRFSDIIVGISGMFLVSKQTTSISLNGFFFE